MLPQKKFWAGYATALDALLTQYL